MDVDQRVEGLGAELRRARALRGLSQEALAERADLSRNFVAQIERGESHPTVGTLARLAAALATTVGELLGEHAEAAPVTDLVGVPLIADTIAAGPARMVDDQIERRESLPVELLHRIGVDPRRAVLVRLGRDQDSMADTIPPGATVLVDRTPVNAVQPRGIYAVREESHGETGCSVKRLVLDPGSRVLILLSDNPAHLPRAVRVRSGQALADLIVGRVAWWLPPAG